MQETFAVNLSVAKKPWVFLEVVMLQQDNLPLAIGLNRLIIGTIVVLKGLL